MKCIKTKEGDIKRVADKEAEAMFRAGEATFVPKAEWKKNNPEHEQRAKAEAARKARQEAEKAD